MVGRRVQSVQSQGEEQYCFVDEQQILSPLLLDAMRLFLVGQPRANCSYVTGTFRRRGLGVPQRNAFRYRPNPTVVLGRRVNDKVIEDVHDLVSWWVYRLI
jgi:hypothetical protein